MFGWNVILENAHLFYFEMQCKKVCHQLLIEIH